MSLSTTGGQNSIFCTNSRFHKVVDLPKFKALLRVGLEMGPYYLKWAAKSTLRYRVDPSHLTFLGYINYPASRLI
jgi:hypothetical protein